MQSRDLAIFINSTDNFSDCWNPFFTLLEKYWPEYTGRIYLNTENYQYYLKDKNLKVINNEGNDREWSECLLRGLNQVNECNILYLQEDYFIKKKVNDKKIQKYYNIFKEGNFDCLQLTSFNTNGPFIENTCFSETWEISVKAKFRISTQPAIWKKESLINLLRKWENGWQFEKFANIRARKLPLKIMNVNKNVLSENGEIFPYVSTGIMHGKWILEVKDVFQNEGISINYNKRGFFEYRKKPSFLKKIHKRIIHLPAIIKSYIFS